MKKGTPKSKQKETDAHQIEIHGWNDVAQSKGRVEKGVWLTFFVLAWTGLMYYTVVTAMEFYNNPLITTQTVVLGQEMKLPELAICPSNTIDFANLLTHECRKFSIEKLYMLMGEVVNVNVNLSTLIERGTSLWERVEATELGDGLPKVSGGGAASANPCVIDPYPYETVPELLLRLSFSVEQLFPSCSIVTREIHCPDIIEPYYDPSEGVCYHVTAGNRFTQRRPGMGLELVIDLNSASAPPISLMKNMDHGVQITAFAEQAVTVATENNYLLGAGAHHHVNLNRREVRMANVTYGPHKQSCSPKDRTLKFLNATYSFGLCKQDCRLASIFEACNCIHPFDQRFLMFDQEVVPLCSAEVMHGCVNEVARNESKSEESDPGTCEACTQACNQVLFDMSVSSAPLMPAVLLEREKIGAGVGAGDAVATTESSDLWRRKRAATTTPSTDNGPTVTTAVSYDRDIEWGDILHVSVAYNSFETMLVEQTESVTIATCLSNLGGQFGLWIGASLFTMLQLAVYFIRKCCSCCK